MCDRTRSIGTSHRRRAGAACPRKPSSGPGRQGLLAGASESASESVSIRLMRTAGGRWINYPGWLKHAESDPLTFSIIHLGCANSAPTTRMQEHEINENVEGEEKK